MVYIHIHPPILYIEWLEDGLEPQELQLMIKGLVGGLRTLVLAFVLLFLASRPLRHLVLNGFGWKHVYFFKKTYRCS